MRRTLIAGNWKMNGNFAANRILLEEIKAASVRDRACEILVCSPAPYLSQCQQILAGSNVAWGAQDVSSHVPGAYTGEVAAAMLADCACRYVIVGHSERRTYHRESNELVAQKAQRAIEHGVVPIICVGESLSQREQGLTKAVVGAQLQVALDVLPASAVGEIVVAYEPVWAIGTGQTATPEVAQEVHAYLRTLLLQKNAEAGMQVRIVYGGSMKPDNAQALLAMEDIDGGLIGGAALKSSDFMAIVAAA